MYYGIHVDEIHIESNSKSLGVNSQIYSTKELEIVQQNMKVAYKVVDYMKQSNYDSIKKLIISNNNPYISNIDEFLSKMEQLEPDLGSIEDGFIPLGFFFKENGDLHISGKILRSKLNHEFSIEYKCDLSHKNILFIDFKL